jgi:pimeloyl-ACP methyl ester carboxylesterase
VEGFFVDIPSGVLFARHLGGVGDPVVGVHGLGGSHLNWVFAAPYLEPLGAVTAFDLPGFGYSPPSRSFSMRRMAKATIEYLERLEAPALLIGNSMGGVISILVAAERPDLLRGLVLLAPASAPRWGDPRLDPLVARRLLLQGTPALGTAVIEKYWRSTTPRQQIADTLAVVCHRPERIPAGLEDETLQMTEIRRRQPWAVEAIVRSGRSTAFTVARRREFRATVESIKTPTFVIQGEHDRIIPGSGVERLAEWRPDWAHVVMEDVGHCAQIEAPAEFAKLVLRWAEDTLWAGTHAQGGPASQIR